MLFRRGQAFIKICSMSCLSFASMFAADQKDFQKEGLRFGKQAHASSVDFENSLCVDDITPIDQKGKTFDPREAKRRVKEQDIPKNAISDISGAQRMNVKPLDEESISHSDSLVCDYEKGFIQPEVSEFETDYKIETCLQYNEAPFELEVAHKLHVKVKKTPAVEKEVHICLGHRREKACAYGKREAAIKKQKKKLALDATIKSYEVEKVKGDQSILIKWNHHDDATACSNCRVEKRVIMEGRSEVEEEWLAENLPNATLSQSPQCTFISSTKQNPETRTVDGVNISRSWSKKDLFMCHRDQIKCPFIDSYQCSQIKRECKQFLGEQCAIWELSFKCRVGKSKNTSPIIHTERSFGSDNALWETDYKPNNSFAEAATKLQVFEEMKREFEQSNQPNIAHVQLFAGKKSQCSKSVAGDLMYDCCFSFQGLTNNLKLSKCTTDELALAEMREKGLCYYVGHHKEEFIGLWKSRTEHTYCCFPTKLSRVLQQEGRKQLGIDWGSSKAPNCRGLNQDEIHRLDLAKIDLSEAYNTIPSVEMTDKIQGIKERLQKRLAEFEGQQ